MATAVLFATFLLIATAASAGSDTTNPFTSSTPNPCNGDNVTFTGQHHVVNNGHMNPDGTVFINFTDQMTGSGPGSPSGLQYNVGLTAKQNGKFPPGPVIFRSRTKVISDGPAQNFFETFFMRINQDGTLGAAIGPESDCRG
jgi:hypothetical protein